MHVTEPPLHVGVVVAERVCAFAGRPEDEADFPPDALRRDGRDGADVDDVLRTVHVTEGELVLLARVDG